VVGSDLSDVSARERGRPRPSRLAGRGPSCAAKSSCSR